jgi:hypothetical protein
VQYYLTLEAAFPHFEHGLQTPIENASKEGSTLWAALYFPNFAASSVGPLRSLVRIRDFHIDPSGTEVSGVPARSSFRKKRVLRLLVLFRKLGSHERKPKREIFFDQSPGLS